MNYRKNNGSKIFSGILAVLLVLVIAAGVVGIGYMSNWFTDWTKFEQEEEQPADEEQGDEETANGGAVISGSTENGVSLMSAKIATANYADYGVSTLAETAYSLTATIEPDNASDKTVDWSVAFANPSSSWASGKTVTDYVTVTPTSDGALTATVECLQAFGEQIIVTVTSRMLSSVNATCTVDYAKKITSADILLVNNDGLAPSYDEENVMDFSREGYSYSFSDQAEYSVYTINDSFSIDITYKGTDNFLAYLCDTFSLEEADYFVNEISYSSIVSGVPMIYSLYDFMYVWQDLSGVSDAMNAYDGAIMEVTATYTGTYSNFEVTVPIYIGEVNLGVSVSNINLNNSSILF